MKVIRAYVIRLYRRDATALAGVVEDVQSSRSAAFRSFAELAELLNGRRAFARRRAATTTSTTPEGADSAPTSPYPPGAPTP